MPDETRTTSRLPPGIAAGSPQFRRISVSLFIGGFLTFWLLWWVQPMLPFFASDFGVSAGKSSLLISAAAAGLAIGLLPAATLSDRYGRKPVMTLSLAIAAVLTMATAAIHDFSTMVALRGLLGIALAGMPAVAMAYLAEEIEPQSLGRATGGYLSGSVLGAAGGRIVTAGLGEFVSWRGVVLAVGLIAIAAILAFWRILPRSKRFIAARHRIESQRQPSLLQRAGHVVRDPGLPWLFLFAFLATGCYVTIYSYLPFRLAAPPLNVRPVWITAIFSIYFVGIVGANWAGRQADRIGRRKLLWPTTLGVLVGLAITYVQSVAVITVGVVIITFSFFSSHTVASSWTGRRADSESKALAASLYLSAYYLGPSIIGPIAGHFWQLHGWTGVLEVLVPCLALATLIALRLRKLEPLSRREM
jgi:YNFM family putative membrane transporter